VIRSLPDQDRRWLLEQLGQDTADLNSQELVELDLVDQAFNVLAQKADLYRFTDGEPIVAA